MMKKLFLLVILSAISYADGYSRQAHKTTIQLSESGFVPIQDDEMRISLIEFVQPVNENYVVIHSRPNGISVINNEGKLITQLGRSGRGPFEWQTPEYIQFTHENVFIWDNNGAKFLSFNEEFQPDEELFGVRPGIRGFQFKDKQSIAVFQRHPVHKEFVKLYSRRENELFSLIKNFGELSDEGRILFFVSRAGGILWNGDDLVWCDPAVPELSVYNTREDHMYSLPFEDEQFSVDRWSVTRETPDRIREYVFGNSRIVSLQKLKEHILVEVEHFSNGESKITYHLFDFDYAYTGSVDAGPGEWPHYIRGVEGNRLFYWGEDYYETGEMNRIRVREVIVE